jgi:hypothetical protein
MNIIYEASRIISFIRKKEQQKDRTAWTRWRKIVQEIYHDKIFRNRILLAINSGVADLQEIKNYGEVISLIVKTEKNSERNELLRLIFLFLELLKKSNDIIIYNRIKNSIENIIPKGQEFDSEIGVIVEDWLNKAGENKFYFKIRLKGTLNIILLDFLLRWIFLWLHKTGTFFSNSDNNFAFHALSQYIIIPILIISYAYYRDNVIRKKTIQIFKDLERTDLRIVVHQSPWNFLFATFLVITGAIISANPDNLFFLDFIMYLSYILLILIQLSKSFPRIPDFVEQIEGINLYQVKNNLNHLENDEEIIETEVNLRSAINKMEAFVLEAALFGALTFSAYLQIIGLEGVNTELFSQLTQSLMDIFRCTVDFKWECNADFYHLFLKKENLYAVLAYQTLFCSVFFLAVIATRLKFNDLSNYVDKFLQLSKTYNDKEEQSIQNNNGSSEGFTQKIRKFLVNANLTMEQTVPIIEYMQFFRTLGIFTFFLTIITGGFFISVSLALFLALLTIATYVFYNMNLIRQQIDNFYTKIQEFHFKTERKISYIIFITLFFSFISRTFELSFVLSVIVPMTGFVFLALNFLISLFIPEKFEDEEIKTDMFVNTGALSIISKKLLKIALSLLFVGFLFKTAHWPGANLMLLFSMLLISVYLLTGKKTKEGTFLLDFIISIALFWIIAVIPIKILEWPLSEIVNITALLMISVLLLILFLKRNNLLKSTVKSIFIISFIGMMMQFSFSSFALVRLSLNYNYYLYFPITDKITSPLENGGLSDAKTKNQLDSLHMYLARIDTIFTTNKNWPKFYEEGIKSDIAKNELCSFAAENYSDSISLSYALKWSDKIIARNSGFVYLETNLKLLFKLSRKDIFLERFKTMEKYQYLNQKNKTAFENLKKLKMEIEQGIIKNPKDSLNLSE